MDGFPQVARQHKAWLVGGAVRWMCSPERPVLGTNTVVQPVLGHTSNGTGTGTGSAASGPAEQHAAVQELKDEARVSVFWT